MSFFWSQNGDAPKLGKVCQHLLLQQRVKGLTHDHISTLVFNGADFNLEFPKGSPWRVTGERAAFLPGHLKVYSWNLSTPTPQTSISAPSPKTMQKFCLRHRTPGSGDQEHERPRIFEHEMTTEEIEARTPLIGKLHFAGVKTTEIHKALQTPGKRLGKAGQQTVSARAACVCEAIC